MMSVDDGIEIGQIRITAAAMYRFPAIPPPERMYPIFPVPVHHDRYFLLEKVI